MSEFTAQTNNTMKNSRAANAYISTDRMLLLAKSTLLSMSHEAFSKLRDQHPAAAGALMHTLSLNLAERLRTYGNRAAQEIHSHEFEMKELAPESRANIVKILANLMGIKGVKA